MSTSAIEQSAIVPMKLNFQQRSLSPNKMLFEYYRMSGRCTRQEWANLLLAGESRNCKAGFGAGDETMNASQMLYTVPSDNTERLKKYM